MNGVGHHFVGTGNLVSGTVGRVFNDCINAFDLMPNGLRDADKIF